MTEQQRLNPIMLSAILVLAFAACVLAFLAFKAPASAAESEPEASEVMLPAKYEWRLQAAASPGALDYAHMQAMAERVKEITQGEFVIEILPAGDVAKGPAVFDAVKSGEVQMGAGWPNWWSARDPDWNLIQASPFMFMNTEASMVFHLADRGSDLANELANKEGVLWRPSYWPGMEFGMHSTFEAKSIADFEGKSVRVGAGLAKETFSKATGAHVVSAVPEELLSALEAGRLHGVEWTTPAASKIMGFDKYCQYGTVPAIWQPSDLGDFLINQEAYAKLPAHCQAALECAIRELSLRLTAYGKMRDIEAFEGFLEAGMKIRKWSDDDIRHYRDVCEEVYLGHTFQSSSFARILAEERRFKKQFDAFNETYAMPKRSFTQPAGGG